MWNDGRLIAVPQANCSNLAFNFFNLWALGANQSPVYYYSSSRNQWTTVSLSVTNPSSYYVYAMTWDSTNNYLLIHVGSPARGGFLATLFKLTTNVYPPASTELINNHLAYRGQVYSAATLPQNSSSNYGSCLLPLAFCFHLTDIYLFTDLVLAGYFDIAGSTYAPNLALFSNGVWSDLLALDAEAVINCVAASGRNLFYSLFDFVDLGEPLTIGGFNIDSGANLLPYDLITTAGGVIQIIYADNSDSLVYFGGNFQVRLPNGNLISSGLSLYFSFITFPSYYLPPHCPILNTSFACILWQFPSPFEGPLPFSISSSLFPLFPPSFPFALPPLSSSRLSFISFLLSPSPLPTPLSLLFTFPNI